MFRDGRIPDKRQSTSESDSRDRGTFTGPSSDLPRTNEPKIGVRM